MAGLSKCFEFPPILTFLQNIPLRACVWERKLDTELQANTEGEGRKEKQSSLKMSQPCGDSVVVHGTSVKWLRNTKEEIKESVILHLEMGFVSEHLLSGFVTIAQIFSPSSPTGGSLGPVPWPAF